MADELKKDFVKFFKETGSQLKNDYENRIGQRATQLLDSPEFRTYAEREKTFQAKAAPFKAEAMRILEDKNLSEEQRSKQLKDLDKKFTEAVGTDLKKLEEARMELENKIDRTTDPAPDGTVRAALNRDREIEDVGKLLKGFAERKAQEAASLSQPTRGPSQDSTPPSEAQGKRKQVATWMDQARDAAKGYVVALQDMASPENKDRTKGGMPAAKPSGRTLT